MTPEAWPERTLRNMLATEASIPDMTRAELEAFIAEGEADVEAGRVVSREEAMQDARSMVEKAKQRRG